MEKRNEVVALILGYFVDAGSTVEEASDLANELLDELENRVGMLPPNFLDTVTGEYVTKSELLNHYDIDGDFEWKK